MASDRPAPTLGAAAEPKPVVFVHTNRKQLVGARVARYSLLARSAHAAEFDVRILIAEEQPALRGLQGKTYLRDGRIATWDDWDLQSFTPLRFLPPQEMDYRGRALVIDPDIFAYADVWELLSRGMQGRSILCCSRQAAGRRSFDSSVMLLDCARLEHWRFPEAIDEMFAHRRDYRAWVSLALEDEERIGPIEPEWNDYDHLSPDTKLLHNTRRLTQPWKAGLPIDFRTERPRVAGRKWGVVPKGWIRELRLLSKGQSTLLLRRYRSHPDPAQERGFFQLLAAGIDAGEVPPDEIEEAVGRGWVRRDLRECLARAREAAPA